MLTSRYLLKVLLERITNDMCHKYLTIVINLENITHLLIKKKDIQSYNNM